MANYLLYHTSRSALAKDIISLVSNYNAKEASEQELQETVRAWSEKCPNLLFDTENAESQVISPKLRKLIGKKRSVIIFKALEDTRSQRNI